MPSILRNTISDRKRKNFIINGNFDFWQRGTNTFMSTTGTYLADRFIGYESGIGAMVQERDTDVPTFAQSGYNSTYSFKATNDNTTALAANDYAQLAYAVEGYDYAELHGKTMTLSFWVKSSVAGQFSVAFDRDTPSRRVYIQSYTVDSANTWERKVITLPTDTAVSGWDFGNGRGVRINWNLGLGSNLNGGSEGAWFDDSGNNNFGLVTDNTTWATTNGSTFNVSQIMLTSGDADEGVFRRYGDSAEEELSACQRYFEKSYDLNVTPGTAFDEGRVIDGGVVNASSSTADIFTDVPFRVRKRATASATIYDLAGGSGNVLTFNNQGSVINAAFATTVNILGEHSISVRTNNIGTSAAGHAFQWTADAEIL